MQHSDNIISFRLHQREKKQERGNTVLTQSNEKWNVVVIKDVLLLMGTQIFHSEIRPHIMNKIIFTIEQKFNEIENTKV